APLQRGGSHRHVLLGGVARDAPAAVDAEGGEERVVVIDDRAVHVDGPRGPGLVLRIDDGCAAAPRGRRKAAGHHSHGQTENGPASKTTRGSGSQHGSSGLGAAATTAGYGVSELRGDDMKADVVDATDATQT